MQSPLLSVKNLSVNYGNFQALRGLNFDGRQGEIIGVIGPNGAGKSTLVKAICGFQNYDTGQISVAGQVVEPGQLPPGLVGLVPQEIGLYPFLTARENLDFFARASGLSGDEANKSVDKALYATGMRVHADKPVSDLSGGMKRRINFAAAILSDPKLLILDEPTVGVDAGARDDLLALAVEQAARGTSILLITHELEQAEHMCSRVLVLNNGQRQYFSPPRTLLKQVFGESEDVRFQLTRPADQRLAKFLGDIGFTYSSSEGCWAGLFLGEPETISKQTRNAAETTGNVVRELVIRKPGLETLIRHLSKPSETQAAA